MNTKISAAITAVGAYLPDYILTNAELEKLVETNDEWIRSRTGISERRILKGEGLATSDMAAPALLDICKNRGISPEEIDCDSMLSSSLIIDQSYPNAAYTGKGVT